ncbi:hypothetical protein GCM10025777_14300 [Membranihabitans marinus]
MHGDEINGIEIVRRCIETNLFNQLTSGSVIAIPVLNTYGFMNFSRYLPDGKDVNRSFPGNSKGSLASRVAHVMTKKILPIIDFGIDMHTGGDNRFNFPQIRYTTGSEEGRELAYAFKPPIVIANSTIRKTLRAQAKTKNIPIIVYEAGESLRLDQDSIAIGIEGIKNVLRHKNMLEPMPQHDTDCLSFKKLSWLRAPQSGIFIWKTPSGHHVKKTDILGYIYSPIGEEKIPILATRTGYIIGHNNNPVVNIGDALFHIAYE